MNISGCGVTITHSGAGKNAERAAFQLLVSNFVVASGDMVFVIGGSGAGKTTLLRAIAGLHPCETESFRLDPPTAVVRVLSQTPQLLPWRCVRSNLKLPGEISGRQYDPKVATDLLQSLAVAETIDKFPHQLSGGMHARVALAQILADRPDVLLLDEPTAALDEHLRQFCLAVTERHVRLNGAVAIIATHDLHSVSEWASKVFLVEQSLKSSSLTEINLSQLDWNGTVPEQRVKRLRERLRAIPDASGVVA